MLRLSEIEESDIPVPKGFRGFNPFGDFRIYTRNLPHWRQDGATYFVTFRAADSIPERIWRDMCDEAIEWRKDIVEALERYEGILPDSIQRRYETFQRRYQARLEKQLDRCSGKCRLRQDSNRTLVANSLKHFHGERYELFAAVIMPNHCHGVLRPIDGHDLEDVIGSWKSFTSRRIETTEPEFWQPESFDRIIRDEGHFRRAVRYIIRNPVKANLPKTDFWLWSTHINHPFVENPPDVDS